MDTFYWIYPGNVWSAHQAPDDAALAKETWTCSGCRLVRPGVQSVDVRLNSNSGLDKPLTFVWISIGLVWRDLLGPIPSEILTRKLHFGRVLRLDGNPLEGWATFHGRRRVIVGGEQHVKYTVCNSCGRATYFSTGKQYLCPAPSGGAEIYETNLPGGLLFHSDLFQQLDCGGGEGNSALRN